MTSTSPSQTPPASSPGPRRFRLPRPRRAASQSAVGFDTRMALMEHLRELRDRLIRAVLAVALTTVLAFLFVEPLMDVFLDLAPTDLTIQATQPAETFASYFRVALTFGIAAAMPLIVYQIFRFLSPGLHKNERRWLLLGLPMITFFFAAGVLFCYYVLLPPAINFLFSFGDARIEDQWRISDYIGFVTNFLLAAGLAFQLPPVMFMLAKLGIVDAKRLSRFRRYAVVLAVVAAAVITPTTDPLNLMLLAVPIYLLYELGVLMARAA